MKKTKRFVSWLLVLTIALTACSQAVPAGQGIRGQVLLGPNCPVVQQGEECPDTPYQTELAVTSLDGLRVIQQFSSDEDGRFEVSLPIGVYAIRSVEPGGLPYCTTNEPVTVSEGAMTETTVLCDTGIR